MTHSTHQCAQLGYSPPCVTNWNRIKYSQNSPHLCAGWNIPPCILRWAGTFRLENSGWNLPGWNRSGWNIPKTLLPLARTQNNQQKRPRTYYGRILHLSSMATRIIGPFDVVSVCLHNGASALLEIVMHFKG